MYLWISKKHILQIITIPSGAIMMLSLDSPKVSPSQFAFVNIKKADGRRWSVASLPRYCENGGEYENVQLEQFKPNVPILSFWQHGFAAVAGTAQHPGPATYPVNVLVRFASSWWYCNVSSASPTFYQERLHQLAAPHPPSELQTMHK